MKKLLASLAAALVLVGSQDAHAATFTHRYGACDGATHWTSDFDPNSSAVYLNYSIDAEDYWGPVRLVVQMRRWVDDVTFYTLDVQGFHYSGRRGPFSAHQLIYLVYRCSAVYVGSSGHGQYDFTVTG